MNERDLEARLRDTFRRQAEDADPGALIERLYAIPAAVEPVQEHWWHRIGLGAARRPDQRGTRVRGVSKMLSATGVAAILAATALGATFLLADVAAPEEGDAPGAAPGTEDWVSVTGQQVFECDGSGVCTGVNTMSDPRLDGTASITYGAGSESPAAVGDYTLWGTAVVANEGGSWIGQWVGFVDEDGLHHTMVWLDGSGDYEGLSFLEQGFQLEEDGPLQLSGLLYRGNIPPTVVRAAVP